MTKRNILATSALLAVILLVSCGGGIKVAEPEGRITIGETGKVFKDSTDLLEHLKDERPDEYLTLYELSKTSENLTSEYIDEKTKILSDETEVSYKSDEAGAITEKKYIEILKSKYELDDDPVSVIKAYYSSLSDRKFEAAFGLLHPGGTSFAKFQNPEAFEISNTGFSETMKITDYKVQSIDLNDRGNEPVLKVGVKLVGFFVKEKLEDADTRDLSPEELREMEQKAAQNPAIENLSATEWEFKETGIVWVTLTTQNKNWLIYDIP